MSITDLDTDLDNLTLTLIADFDAPIEKVWELWADPRKLERWWGPPSHPATFEKHDLSAGGEVTYFMTGPEGDTHRGWWRIESVEPPRSLELTDGFADEDGNPNDDLPTTQMAMELTEHDGGTRMTMRSRFPSREQMQELVDMGMTEGLREAVGQMDAILAE
jgi:uncharacterized protein YndB with AHSA1/START domain